MDYILFLITPKLFILHKLIKIFILTIGKHLFNMLIVISNTISNKW